MKFAFIIPDGMGDYPVSKLNGKTPVEYAKTPNLDKISLNGETGLCHTTPNGFSPGSDVCISSLLGYNPEIYYSGRAPFEARALDIPISNNDLIMRLNFINISEQDTINDHSAGHITTDEADELITALAEELETEDFKFYTGVSYRHILLWKNKPDFECKMTPPHDVPGEPFKNHLPSGKDAEKIVEMILKSRDILDNHRVNLRRKKENKPTANLMWPWGNGYIPTMETFKEKFGVKGSVISAVGLIKGLAKFLNLKEIDVPGITAHFDTDYHAKGQYAIEALKEHDLIIVHIEAPDEAGHIADIEEKVKAIERIDEHIIGPVLNALEKHGDFRIIVSPDHYTPVEKRIHVNNPVPYAIYGTDITTKSNLTFSEKHAAKNGIVFLDGYKLMPYFLGIFRD